MGVKWTTNDRKIVAVLYRGVVEPFSLDIVEEHFSRLRGS